MAYVSRLDNDYLVILVTPREAVQLRDEIIDPEKYPWQNAESERVALDIRMQIDQLLLQSASAKINFLMEGVRHAQEQPVEDDDDDA